MPDRPADAAAPLGDAPRHPRRNATLRAIGAVLALGLGAVAVWLIVTSSSQKRLELGVLAGLWGLLIGTFVAFGTRRHTRPAAADAPGLELMLRAHAEMERSDEAAARQRFEARLEQMLRREIQTSFAAELAALRDEVAGLRNELLEKVGGQLRLERIETTRVIGSDIEALYREIDQLKRGSRVLEAEPAPSVLRAAEPPPAVEPAPTVEPAVELVTPAAATSEATREATREAASEAALPEAAWAHADISMTQPIAPVREPGPLLPAAGSTEDPFAALPRLSVFHDPGPAEPRVSAPEPAAASGPSTAPGPAPAAETRGSGGRHGRADHERPAAGGRRRRASDDDDNVLARILARESAQR